MTWVLGKPAGMGFLALNYSRAGPICGHPPSRGSCCSRRTPEGQDKAAIVFPHLRRTEVMFSDVDQTSLQSGRLGF